MRDYLTLVVGPFRFLLDADGVCEVLEPDVGPADAWSRHRWWRNRAVPVWSLRQELDLPSRVERQTVICRCSGDLVALEVDRVIGLGRRDQGGARPMAPLPPLVLRLLDGACLDSHTGLPVLHCRRDLTLAGT